VSGDRQGILGFLDVLAQLGSVGNGSWREGVPGRSIRCEILFEQIKSFLLL